jgi:hypothetical protein
MNLSGLSSASPFSSSSISSKGDEDKKNSPKGFADLLATMRSAAQSSTAPSSTTQSAASSSALQSSADTQTAYQESFQLLRDKVERIVSKLQLNTTGDPLRIHLNMNGELVVTGEGSQVAEFQNAISSEPGLKDLFTQVAKLAEQMAKTDNVGIDEILNSSDSQSENLRLPKRFSVVIDGTEAEAEMS